MKNPGLLICFGIYNAICLSSIAQYVPALHVIIRLDVFRPTGNATDTLIVGIKAMSPTAEIVATIPSTVAIVDA